MKVTEIREIDDKLLGFEIQNFLLSRGYTVKILRSIPDVSIKRVPRFLSRLREFQFCEFELGGCTFKVWEPRWDREYMRRGLRVRHIIATEISAHCHQRMALVRDRFTSF
jgi:hypothetical protein